MTALSRLGLALALCAGLALPATAQEDTRSLQELNNDLRINPVSTAALETLLTRAEAGDTAAMVSVFQALNAGLGAERDRDTALIWLERAAASGEQPQARVILGNILLNREEDRAAALEQWRIAADKGNVGALIRMAENAPLEFGRRIQLGLVAAGQDVGTVDGLLGPKTRDAMAAYATAQGLGDACAEEIASPGCLRQLARKGFFAPRS
jgi:TPR repeat protein